MITFNHVEVRYPDGTAAVSDVSFEVPAGQFCVLLGPSGAGKTTLLKTVNGLVTPTTGTLSVANQTVNRDHLAETRRKVAMIHQQFNLVARATVERNVISGGVAEHPAWRIWSGHYPIAVREHAAKLCERMGLAPTQFQRRAAELSGGQQQRVGIARAFFLNAAVVLADEPVASLDPQTSKDVMSLLRDAAGERDSTVLCSLHQIDLAREFADRIIGMRAGKVLWDLASDAMTDQHLTALYDTLPTPAEARA